MEIFNKIYDQLFHGLTPAQAILVTCLIILGVGTVIAQYKQKGGK